MCFIQTMEKVQFESQNSSSSNNSSSSSSSSGSNAEETQNFRALILNQGKEINLRVCISHVVFGRCRTDERVYCGSEMAGCLFCLSRQSISLSYKCLARRLLNFISRIKRRGSCHVLIPSSSIRDYN
jgi:hypothetical protein